MGSSSNRDTISSNDKPKLYWDFHQDINDEYNDYGVLKGSVYIKEGNYCKGIQIEGIRVKTNNEKFKFIYNGNCIQNVNDNIYYYNITYDKNSKYKFPKAIIMELSDEKNAVIVGDIFFEDKPLKLKLFLFLPRITTNIFQ